MSLDKAITHGKEKRKPYRGSKAIDPSCRNHGGGRKYACPWCAENRQHKFRDKHPEPPKEEPQIISAVDCNDCRYYPPSSLNGKPCTQCDMGNPLMNCFSPKEETE